MIEFNKKYTDIYLSLNLMTKNYLKLTFRKNENFLISCASEIENGTMIILKDFCIHKQENMIYVEGTRIFYYFHIIKLGEIYSLEYAPTPIKYGDPVLDKIQVTDSDFETYSKYYMFPRSLWKKDEVYKVLKRKIYRRKKSHKYELKTNAKVYIINDGNLGDVTNV